MDTNEVVKNVMNSDEVEKQVTDMILANKDVLVDMKPDGTAVVSELTKPGFWESYGSAIGFGSGCFLVGIATTFGGIKLYKWLKEKKEKADIEKAFEEKAKAEAEKAKQNGGKVDDAETAEEAKTE